MSRGSFLWEIPFIVFDEVRRLQELQIVTAFSRHFHGLKRPGGSPLKPFARLRRFGSDECLEDPGSGRLNVSYSTVSGGSWEVQCLSNLVLRVGLLKKLYLRASLRFGDSGGWK